MTTQVFSKLLFEPILSLFELLFSFLDFVPPARATLVSRVTPVTRFIVTTKLVGNEYATGTERIMNIVVTLNTN